MSKVMYIGLLGLCLALFLAGCSTPVEVTSVGATPQPCDCTKAVDMAKYSGLTQKANGDWYAQDTPDTSSKTWEEMYNLCTQWSESNEESCQVMKEALINNTKLVDVQLKTCADEMEDWKIRYETCIKR